MTHHISFHPRTSPVYKSSGLTPVLRNVPPQDCKNWLAHQPILSPGIGQESCRNTWGTIMPSSILMSSPPLLRMTTPPFASALILAWALSPKSRTKLGLSMPTNWRKVLFYTSLAIHFGLMHRAPICGGMIMLKESGIYPCSVLQVIVPTYTSSAVIKFLHEHPRLDRSTGPRADLGCIQWL